MVEWRTALYFLQDQLFPQNFSSLQIRILFFLVNINAHLVTNMDKRKSKNLFIHLDILSM